MSNLCKSFLRAAKLVVLAAAASAAILLMACEQASTRIVTTTSVPEPAPTPTPPQQPTDVTLPSLSIADARATEGQSLRFVVTLSAASSSTVTVHYNIEYDDGSARPAYDYRPFMSFGTLRFSAGETRKTISVRTFDDTRAENEETLYIEINYARGATISDDRATGTIIDNDVGIPSHGDSFLTAHVLPNCGSGNRDWTINGGLTAGDKDYFKLVCVDARGTLTAWTTGTTDTYGTLHYRNYGDRAVANDDGGSGSNFRVSRPAAVGTYYLEVKGLSSSTTGSYVLRVQWRPYDTSDRSQNADTITSGGSYPRYLHHNDADWFKFNPGSGGGCIDVRVWSGIESRFRSSFATDPAAFVSDGQGGAKLMEDNNGGTGLNFHMSGRLRKHGYFYFVRVTQALRLRGPYTLHLTVSNASSCSGALN